MMTAKDVRTTVLEVATMLYSAICALARVCDGATADDGHGFNKFDARWGHEMSRQDPEGWSVDDCAYIRKRITKYCEQLLGYGIDLNTIPVIGVESARAIVSRGLGWIGLRWSLQDPLFGEIKEAVKGIGARWDRDAREWVCSVKAKGVFEIAEQYGFDIPPEAMAVSEQEVFTPGTIGIEDGVFIFCLEYDREAIAELKRFWGKRAWDREARVWRIQVDDVNAGKVFDFASNWGMTIRSDASREARRLMDELAKARDNGSPCLGRSCDSCDATAKECPDKGRQHELPGVSEEPVDRWGPGWSSRGAKSLFE